MNTDEDLIEDILRAESIKQAAPGSAVTEDAIFLALRLRPRSAERQTVRRASSSPPPAWFALALQDLRGRSLTIREFLTLSRRQDATINEARDVGRWLRESGRTSYKSHGWRKFRI